MRLIIEGFSAVGQLMGETYSLPPFEGLPCASWSYKRCSRSISLKQHNQTPSQWDAPISQMRKLSLRS